MIKNIAKNRIKRHIALVLCLIMILSSITSIYQSIPMYNTYADERLMETITDKNNLVGDSKSNFEGSIITKTAIESNPSTMSAITGVPLQNEEGYYEIASSEQLVWFRNLVNGTLDDVEQNRKANAILIDDVDMSQILVDGIWIPIGQTSANSYQGIFDGNNKEIKNYNVTYTANYQALFGYIVDATIKNINISGNINSNKTYSAAIVSFANGSEIYNCNNYATITATKNYVAGIVAQSINSKIINCDNYGDINISATGGAGIVIQAVNTLIEGSNNYAKISGSGQNLAGIVAVHSFQERQPGEEQKIINCKNSGEINANKNAAGIAYQGYMLENCINIGDVKGNSAVAGVVYSGDYIDSCINEGNVTSLGDASAGIVSIAKGDVVNCTNIGNISSMGDYAAGIVGGISGTMVSIKNCINAGDIEGRRHVGGIVGKLINSGKEQSLGERKNTTFSDCYNSGNITGLYSGSEFDGDIGGLIGYVENEYNATETYITNSFSTGNVNGKMEQTSMGGVGGLIGRVTVNVGKVVIDKIYNSGEVIGSKMTGGLIGGLQCFRVSNELQITNSYSVSTEINVQENGDKKTLGGLIGEILFSENVNYENINISNIFYMDSDTIKKAIGSNNATENIGTFNSKSYEYMITDNFVKNLGGSYILYEDIKEGISSEKKDQLEKIFGEYKYPILRSWIGLEDENRYNVQFRGADYTDVKINDESIYATTVKSGETINFTVKSLYEEVIVEGIYIDDEELKSTDNIYTVKNITKDTIIKVLTNGEPLEEELTGKYNITFKSNVENSIVEIKNDKEETIESEENIYKLEKGIYTATISAKGYITKTGTFEVDKSKEFNIILVQEGTQAYEVEIDSSVKTYILSDGLTIDDIDEKKQTTISLYPGEYTYTSEEYGGGNFSIPKDIQLSLKTVNYAYSLKNSDSVTYTMTVTDENGIEYFPGGTNAEDGDKRAYFLLPAKYGKVAYNYKFNVPDLYWGTSGKTYVYEDTKFKELNLSDSGNFVIALKKQLDITVPKGAELIVYQRPKFYIYPAELFDREINENEEDTTYIFDAPYNTNLYYEIKLDGYVKKASYFNVGKTNLQIDIKKSDMLNLDDWKQDVKDESQLYMEANILTNVENNMYLELKEEDEHELYLYRAWQPIDRITGNNYVDPDYNIEIIYGNSVEIIDPYYAGATIKSVKPGLSVVKITYDALDYESGYQVKHYSKLWKENYVCIIVNVSNDIPSTEINTGITTIDEDILYYTRSLNGIENNKLYREYTFTPTAQNNGKSIETKVRVHEPIGDIDWKINNWNDNEYWTEYSKNKDGSYTVNLVDGRNIIEISAGDNTEYYSINAYGLDISIDGATVIKNEDGSLQTEVENGTDIEIRFQGISMPRAKLGAIYNPGYPDKTYLAYTESGEEEHEIISNRTQYDIRTSNIIKLTMPIELGEYNLIDGKIHTSSIGSGFSHKYMTKGGTSKSKYISSGNSEEDVNGYFSSLPDLNFIITGEITEDQIAKEKLKLTMNLENIYNKYPENIFTVEDYSNIKELYETGKVKINNATTLEEAKILATEAIDKIKEIQERVIKENSKIDEFRSTLSKLPDDVNQLGKYNIYLVDDLINKYTAMTENQRSQLTGKEQEKYIKIKSAYENGLKELLPYKLSLKISADNEVAEKAISNMIEHIRTNGENSQNFFNLNVVKRDVKGNLIKETLENKEEAYADNYVYFEMIPDIFVYTQDKEISGQGWELLNDGRVEQTGENTYRSTAKRTLLVDGTPYEIKKIEISNIDNINKTEKIITNENQTIIFEEAVAEFIMPYENTEIKVIWGVASGNSDDNGEVAKAKTEAIKEITTLYESYKSYHYTDDNWIKLTQIKNEGIDKINSIKEKTEIEKIKTETINQMTEVTKKEGEGEIPNFGQKEGTVDLYVENTTFSGGAWTGTIIKKQGFEYGEEDTMMTIILRALKEEGYGWTGTGGEKASGVDDYKIEYLASITKDGKSLGEFDGEPGSGWMGTLNDFFTNYGFQDFKVSNGKISDGDEIRLMYTQNLGVDLGGTWGNSDTSLKTLKLSTGKIYPIFDSDIYEYTIVVPTKSDKIKVSPTAVNKNYMVKIFLNDKVTSDQEGSSYYKKTRYIPVRSGDYINIGVGEQAWPSMNKQESEARDYEGTWYKLNIITPDDGSNHVIGLIDSLPSSSKIDETYEEELKNIREIYESLTKEEQGKVTNIDKLKEAEERIKFFIQIEAVKALLKKIPVASKITISDKQTVLDAEAAYKELTDEQKLYITVGDVENYNAAIDKLTELGAFVTTPSKITGSQAVPVKEGETIEIKAETKVTNKEATVTITEKQITEAVEKAKKSDASSITVKSTTTEHITKIRVNMPKTSLSKISGERLELKLDTKIGKLALGEKTLKELEKQSKGNTVEITIEEKEISSIADTQRKTIENIKETKIYEVKITSGESQIINLNGQKIKIILPYELQEVQAKNNISIWCVNENKEIEKIEGSYSENTKQITIETDKITTYIIGVDNKISFVDVTQKDWYYESVMYVSERGLFSGTGENTFSPNMPMTRAMLVTVLYRMENSQEVENINPFEDIKEKEWYTDAVKWSTQKDIVKGITKTQFAPDNNITREQLAVMLYRYAQSNEKISNITKNLEEFTDSEKVSEWAKEAIKWATGMEIITGKENKTLDPSGNATRAEVATMLQRFIEKIK